MIFISLKTYEQASGDAVIKLCRIIKKVQAETGVKIMVGAQPFDIRKIVDEVGIEVWAQHLDPIDPGRHFGWLSPYSALKAGATGTMLNHAEHRIDLETINATIAKCRQYGLKTLVGTETIEQARKVVALKPDYLAFENAKLIGSDVSLVDVDADNIKAVVKFTPMPFFVGAGIKTQDHVKKTLALGGQGVILSSGVVTVADPETSLRNLALGFDT